MAKKAIYTRIMEGLAAAGIDDVTKEKAIALRVQFKVKEDQVDDFCKKYAEENKVIATAMRHPACGESIPLFEAEPAAEESEPANAEDADFIEAELTAEDEVNGADAVGESIGANETCFVMDSAVMPVGPLAQNPLADVTAKCFNDIVPASVKEEAKKLEKVGTTWGELSKKFPEGKIPTFNICLAQTAELRKRKDEAKANDPKCEFWKLRALPREEIEDMLWRPGPEYNWLRDAALNKPMAAAKPATPIKNEDKYKKFDLVLKDESNPEAVKTYKLRIWVDTKESEPKGLVYADDMAKHPFLKFHWGFNSKTGLSFEVPKV